jgi:hypothetical protein
MLGIDEEQTHVELRIGPKCLAQMRTIRIGLDTRMLKLYVKVTHLGVQKSRIERGR